MVIIMTDTRERLLTAAAEVFAERGYDGAALADIARRAGYTTGAIYGCFRDKAELLLAVVERVLVAQEAAAVEAASGESPDRLREIAGRFASDEAAMRRALVFEAHVAARRHPGVAELLGRHQRDRLESLTRTLKEAQSAGEVDPELDPAAVAALFMAIPLGLVLLDSAGVDLPGETAWASLAEHTAESLRPRKKGERHGRSR